jgi:hypothetical protein
MTAAGPPTPREEPGRYLASSDQFSGRAARSPHPALMSMQCQYGDFRIVSAPDLSLPQTLQLIGDRAECVDDTGADQLHRCDCGYRDQRRDQRIFDCGNAASVLGQPANGPKVQLYLRARWANVSAPHHHLRDKLDVAEFGGSGIGELLTAGVKPPIIGVNPS